MPARKISIAALPGHTLSKTNGEDTQRWLTGFISEVQEILFRVVQAVNVLIDGDVQIIRLTIQYAAPDTPANGMIVYADGTTWNPGSGAGTYAYESGAWVKL